MPKREPELLTADIREAMEKIERYVKNLSFDEFLADEKTVDAVVRNFEIIGEAARQLPEFFKHAHPSIPWQDLAAFRNVLIHEYFGVDLKMVWQIIEIDLGGLKTQLVELFDERSKG